MLAALEDLFDSWPGTLIVVSHDRYLVERITDQQYAVQGLECRLGESTRASGIVEQRDDGRKLAAGVDGGPDTGHLWADLQCFGGLAVALPGLGWALSTVTDAKGQDAFVGE